MTKQTRITLRHVVEADLPIIVRSTNDPTIRGPYSAIVMRSPHDVQKEFRETGFSSSELERLIICDETGQAVGDVVHFKAKRYADAREAGWRLYGDANRGKGYAYEAVSTLIDYLFMSQNINRIECNIAPQNAPSLRLAEKCGFVREGLLREHCFVQGVYSDSVVLSILRREWQERRPHSSVSTSSDSGAD